MPNFVIKVRCNECLKLIRNNIVACSSCYKSVHDKCLYSFLSKNESNICCYRIFNIFYNHYFSSNLRKYNSIKNTASKKRKFAESESDVTTHNKIRKTASLDNISLASLETSFSTKSGTSESDTSMISTNDDDKNTDNTRNNNNDNNENDGNGRVLAAIATMQAQMNNRFDILDSGNKENKNEIVQLKNRVTNLEKTNNNTSSQIRITGVPQDLDLDLYVIVEKVFTALGFSNTRSVIFSIREIIKNTTNTVSTVNTNVESSDSSHYKQKIILLTVTCPSIRDEIIECKKIYGKLYVKNVFSDLENIDKYKDSLIYVNKVIEYNKFKILKSAQKFVRKHKLHKAFIYDNQVNIQLVENGDRIQIFSVDDLSENLLKRD